MLWEAGDQRLQPPRKVLGNRLGTGLAAQRHSTPEGGQANLTRLALGQVGLDGPADRSIQFIVQIFG
jgi:hypothetical protein